MHLDIYRNSDALFVKVKGRVVLDECDRFKSSILPHLQPGVARLGIDMSGVEFIDSAGLGVLVGLKMTANKNKTRLSIISPSQGVADILYVSKLDGIFETITGTPAEVLRQELCQDEFRLGSAVTGFPTPMAPTRTPPPLVPRPMGPGAAPGGATPPGVPRTMASPPLPGNAPQAPSLPPAAAPGMPPRLSPVPPGGARPGMPPPITPGRPPLPRSGGPSAVPPPMIGRPGIQPMRPAGAPAPPPLGGGVPRPIQPMPPRGGPAMAPPPAGQAAPAPPQQGSIRPLRPMPAGGGRPMPSQPPTPGPPPVEPPRGPSIRPLGVSRPNAAAAPPPAAPLAGMPLEPMDFPGGDSLLEPMEPSYGSDSPGEGLFGGIVGEPDLGPMGDPGDRFEPQLDMSAFGDLGMLDGLTPMGDELSNMDSMPMPDFSGKLDDADAAVYTGRIDLTSDLRLSGTSLTRKPSLEDQVEHHCAAAYEFMRQGDYERSIDEYKAALQLDPDNINANNNLAMLYEKKPSWHQQALDQWERVREISDRLGDPKHLDRAEKHLASLRRMIS